MTTCWKFPKMLLEDLETCPEPLQAWQDRTLFPGSLPLDLHLVHPSYLVISIFWSVPKTESSKEIVMLTRTSDPVRALELD